jgi:hypothetical protein
MTASERVKADQHSYNAWHELMKWTASRLNWARYSIEWLPKPLQISSVGFFSLTFWDFKPQDKNFITRQGFKYLYARITNSLWSLKIPNGVYLRAYDWSGNIVYAYATTNVFLGMGSYAVDINENTFGINDDLDRFSVLVGVVLANKYKGNNISQNMVEQTFLELRKNPSSAEKYLNKLQNGKRTTW